ncbi:hypothetical protein Taro_013971, partial [Colocasia esculenta]|nr:hypothetical protein [Colocasia esculenta]
SLTISINLVASFSQNHLEAVWAQASLYRTLLDVLQHGGATPPRVGGISLAPSFPQGCRKVHEVLCMEYLAVNFPRLVPLWAMLASLLVEVADVAISIVPVLEAVLVVIVVVAVAPPFPIRRHRPIADCSSHLPRLVALGLVRVTPREVQSSLSHSPRQQGSSSRCRGPVVAWAAWLPWPSSPRVGDQGFSWCGLWWVAFLSPASQPRSTSAAMWRLERSVVGASCGEVMHLTFDELQCVFLGFVALLQNIHTKKRNRLEQKRLNNLVYVQYNQRLKDIFQTMKENPGKKDPLVVDELDATNEWLVHHPNLDQEDRVFEGEDFTWASVDEELWVLVMQFKDEDEDEDGIHDGDGDEDNDIDDDETNNEDWRNEDDLDLSDA